MPKFPHRKCPFLVRLTVGPTNIVKASQDYEVLRRVQAAVDAVHSSHHIELEEQGHVKMPLFYLAQTSHLWLCFPPTDGNARLFFIEISSCSDKSISASFFHGWELISLYGVAPQRGTTRDTPPTE